MPETDHRQAEILDNSRFERKKRRAVRSPFFLAKKLFEKSDFACETYGK